MSLTKKCLYYLLIYPLINESYLRNGWMKIQGKVLHLSINVQ